MRDNHSTRRAGLWLQVDCYSGYRGEETPRSFRLGERLLEIRQVLDRRRGPEDEYFKVETEDGNTYLLRRNTRRGWMLE